MTAKAGANRDTYDSATLTIVATNTSTTVKLLDANEARLSVKIMNNSNADIWIKEYAASVDNIKKGTMVLYPGCYYEMEKEKYTGEISAISDDIAGELHITES